MTREEVLKILTGYMSGKIDSESTELYHAIELLVDILESQFFLPSNLDEAAEDNWAEYEYRESPRGLYSTCYVDGFKAGAEWMAGQGKSIVARIGLATNEICCTIPEGILDSLGVRADDEIIIQIRKK